MSSKQWEYYCDSFAANADDEVFKEGHPFFYTIDAIDPGFDFLCTVGIVQRMRYLFSLTQKVSVDDRRAIYTASPWPSMPFTRTGQEFKLSYKAYRFS